MIPDKQPKEQGTSVEQTKTKSSLPSRSEVHRKKKKKRKVKIKFPLIKLLVLFFILLPIGFYCVYSYLQHRPVKNQESSKFVGKLNDNKETAHSFAVMATGMDQKDVKEANKDIAQSNKNTNVEIAKSKVEQAENQKVVVEKKTTASENLHIKNETKKSNEYAIIYHTVQRQETVFSISMKYYQSQEGILLIRQWNGLNGNDIWAGQQLKIPIKK